MHREILRDGQPVQNIIQGLSITHTTGTKRNEVVSNYFEELYIDNVHYPVTLTVSYQIPNKMNTMLIDTYVQIEIIEPGNWVVELSNN